MALCSVISRCLTEDTEKALGQPTIFLLQFQPGMLNSSADSNTNLHDEGIKL